MPLPCPFYLSCNLSVPFHHQSFTIKTSFDKQFAANTFVNKTQLGRIKGEWKSQFGLFLDDLGVWRCKERLENAELSYSTCYPIVLPNDHPFSLLIVQKAHHRVCHSGTKDTLTELRSRFWIPQGRALVRQFIHRCVTCR